jgi:hypothetical protein
VLIVTSSTYDASSDARIAREGVLLCSAGIVCACVRKSSWGCALGPG